MAANMRRSERLRYLISGAVDQSRWHRPWHHLGIEEL